LESLLAYQKASTPMPCHHNDRMTETIELICNLGEVVHGSRGAAGLKHTRLGLDAIQAVYELSDDDRAVLTRLVARHRAVYDSYVTVRQVADSFKVKPRIIKGLAKMDALHGTKRQGKWVFSPREVERFIETHTYSCGVLTITAAEWQVRQSAETQ
jgi:hypothetical protein